MLNLEVTKEFSQIFSTSIYNSSLWKLALCGDEMLWIKFLSWLEKAFNEKIKKIKTLSQAE